MSSFDSPRNQENDQENRPDTGFRHIVIPKVNDHIEMPEDVAGAGHAMYIYSELAGLVEHALCELSIANPDIMTYLSGLLSRFSRTDEILKIHDANDRPIRSVTGLLSFADTLSEPSELWAVHTHIGDVTLYKTGFYQEQSSIENRPKADIELDYIATGKSSYLLASEVDLEGPTASSETLHLLSDAFETWMYGLDQVRRDFYGSSSA